MLTNEIQSDHITAPHVLDGEERTDVEAILNKTYTDCQQANKFFMGFPINMNKVWNGDLAKLFTVHHYSVGDPFHEERTAQNVNNYEKNIILYFAELWNLSREEAWGYVTASSSEALLYAMWNCKVYFRSIGIKKRPVIIYSSEIHYSVPNGSSMLEIPTYYEAAQDLNIPCPAEFSEWPRGVPVNEDKSINLQSFKAIVDTFAKLGYPIITIFICGTTIGHAIDNIEEGSRILEESCKANNTPFWVHVDSALNGAMLPFINPDGDSKIKFDFSVPQVCSMNVSGHKWYGTPFPCGVYVTRQVYREKPKKEFAAYASGWELGPFGCSRNSAASLLLWYHLAKNSFKSQRELAKKQQDLISYTLDLLKGSPTLSAFCSPYRLNDYAFTILLKVVDDSAFLKKYCLPLFNDECLSQIQFLPHVNKAMIDEFVADLEKLLNVDTDSTQEDL